MCNGGAIFEQLGKRLDEVMDWGSGLEIENTLFLEGDGWRMKVGVVEGC